MVAQAFGLWAAVWLALGAAPLPPPTPGPDQVQAALTAGRLRLSASVSGARLRVALTDEEEWVGQVLAVALIDGQRLLLPRLDTTAADRLEFGIDQSLGAQLTIRVEAYARESNSAAPLHAIELAAPPPLPMAPQPATAGAKAPTEVASAPLPWWLIAGAVVATALAGIAVYQEIDDR